MAHPKGIQSLKLGSAAQVLSIVAGYGIQLVTTPYVLARLGLHDFGVWSITGAIAQYGALFDLGVSRAASRFVAISHSESDVRGEGRVVAVCVATLLAVGATLSALAAMAAQLVAPVLGLNDPAQARPLLLSAVAILIVGLLARVLAAASVGRGRTVPATMAVAVLSVLQALGGVAVLVVKPTLIAFAYGTLGGISLGLAVVVGVIFVDEGRLTLAMPNMRIAREIFAYGTISQIAAAGDMLLTQSGKLIAGALIGPSAAGIYELASRPAMAAGILGGASGTALIPHLTRSYVAGGIGGILTHYDHLTRRSTSVALLVPFAMVATAVTAIPLWLGRGREDVVWVLLAILAGTAVNMSSITCGCTLLAIGRPSVIARITVTGGVLQTVVALLATNFFGLLGLTLAIGIGVPIAKLVGIWVMQASAGIPQQLYFRSVRGPYAVAVVATVLALPIGLSTMPQDRQSALTPFIASAFVYLLAYVALGSSRGYLPQASSLWLQQLPVRRRTGRASRKAGPGRFRSVQFIKAREAPTRLEFGRCDSSGQRKSDQSERSTGEL